MKCRYEKAMGVKDCFDCKHKSECIEFYKDFKKAIEDIWRDGEYYDNAKETLKIIKEAGK